MAAKDRELLALLDTVTPADERDRLLGAMRRMTEAPGVADQAHEVYALLDALAGEDTGTDDRAWTRPRRRSPPASPTKNTFFRVG
ncbi:hypothetical protein [Streptomyces formicae]|uniref:Uncharacterized protein n=1 Tax=Streptomyces formicae TaxID=1616117 RepID=A0ABY3WKS0_9ACTN|nr:hypothetical protein [Streptomyces formicae]UNM13217.1 hypothetical protein J4032_18505 [Streptomyces formicae]